MGDWSFDKPLAIGDKLIFEDMIHYDREDEYVQRHTAPFLGPLEQG